MSTTYKLEVWGAQGGHYGNWPYGAKGGKTECSYYTSTNEKLYIVVGAMGGSGQLSSVKTYNGGGAGGASTSGKHIAGAGGGATHIASTNRGELKNYKSFQSEILIVAGGGGGSTWYNDCPNVTGGVGGGISGGNGSSYQNAYIAYGGSQTNGYDFGQGQDGLQPTANGGHSSDEGCGGGGGGWYGGKSSNATVTYGRDYNTGGGGGSGHIGGSVTSGTMQSGVREGNGYAIITWHPNI